MAGLGSKGVDASIILWDLARGKLLHSMKGYHEPGCVAFNPKGSSLAHGSGSRTIELWDVESGRLIKTLEGHTGGVGSVDFSPNIMLLASRSTHNRQVFLWRTDTFERVAKIEFDESGMDWIMNSYLAFHPTLPWLAMVGWDSDNKDLPCIIHIFEIYLAVLLRQPAALPITYTSAKIVLVGDSGVGKTGLGWRLAHGEFKEHPRHMANSSGC